MIDRSQFQIPSDAPPPAVSTDHMEFHKDANGIRMTVGGGVEVRSSDISNGATGVLATAQRAHSRTPAAPSALTPEDTVEIGGQRMTLKTAQMMGLMHRNATTGLYEETTSASSPELHQLQQQADEAEAQHDDHNNPRQELFFEEGERFLSHIPQSVQAASLNDLADTGQITEGTVKQIAADLGVEPHQAAQYIGGAVEMFSRQANGVLAGYGITDGEDFAEWAMNARPSEWRETIKRHQIERTTIGYHELAKGYLEHLHNTDPQAILTADFGPGVTTRKAGREVLLNIPGLGEVSFRSALRAGFVGRGR